MAKQFIPYIGSKKKIIPYIQNLIPNDVETILDGFSGSGRVSFSLAKDYKIISNDYAYYSEVLNQAYLLRTKPDSYYQEIIDHIHTLEPVSGWFSQSYGGLSKLPYSLPNLMRLDAYRSYMDTLSGIDKSVLLASLLLGVSSIDSTLGHYVSYLRNFSKRSYNDLILSVPQSIHFNNNLIDEKDSDNNLIGVGNNSIQLNKIKKDHKVYRKDIFELLDELKKENKKYDLHYIDIPYGANSKMASSRVRYKQYYHLLNTITRNDEPELFGKVGRRVDDRECSVFEEFRKDSDDNFLVQKSIEKLIDKTDSKYIIFSYNNSGRLPIPDLMDVLGDCKILQIPHKENVMSNMKWTNKWDRDFKKNTEFLFLKEN